MSTNTSPLPPIPHSGVQITLRVQYNTSFGQTLYVCGSPLALGAWDPAQAYEMVFTPGSVWQTSFVVPTDREGSFEYKYLVKNGDGSCVWESGANHTLVYNPQRYAVISVSDNWHAQESAMLTGPFKNIIFARHPRTAEQPCPAFSHVADRAEPAKGGDLMLQLRATRISPDHYFCVLGSHPALGSWDEERAVILDDAEFPLWRASVAMSCGAADDDDGKDDKDAAQHKFEPIRYKYGIYDTKKAKVVMWEDGYDRELPSPAELEKSGRLYVRTDENFRYALGNWRGAGVALPVFSLRSEEDHGVGEFLDLIPFIDWAKSVGMHLVQILPINDTVSTHTWTDSYPYGAISVFALHPLYVRMSAMGQLKDAKAAAAIEAEGAKLNTYEAIDYEAVMNLKSRFFKLLYGQERASIVRDAAFWQFVKENEEWLLPYAVFSCMRDRFGTVEYRWWPKYGVWAECRDTFVPFLDPATAETQPKDFDDIAVHFFIQYHAHLQMSKAAQYARSQGVILKGDLPIGVMKNSVDTWVDPSLFKLQYQTGAPPDAFSATGQNWGFPTYNWDEMAKDGYRWWRRRLGKMATYFDAYRIDHILGFFRIWEIPGECVDGMLGQFSPSWPMSRDDLRSFGLDWFDYDRLCRPYIREHMLDRFLGSDNVQEAKRVYLDQYQHGCYHLKAEYATQRRIYDHFTALFDTDCKGCSPAEHDRLCRLRDGLMGLVNEVVFLPARGAPDCYTPRVTLQYSQSYRDLDQHSRDVIQRIYTHYFYERQEPLWEAQAWKKLPALKNATEMLVCGEDLGMVPACVPPTMEKLGILSLNIQRMPKDPKDKFFHPGRAPYMSVVSSSSHDMTNVRAWWEEDGQVTRDFWYDQLGQKGNPPAFAEPWICMDILKQHLYSPAMLAIIPLQDYLATDGALRLPDARAERINVPANPKHYWRFRFHLSIRQLQQAEAFSKSIATVIAESGRNTAL